MSEYVATRAGHLKIHIETKHFGMNYACSECQYSAATTGNLKTCSEYA